MKHKLLLIVLISLCFGLNLNSQSLKKPCAFDEWLNEQQSDPQKASIINQNEAKIQQYLSQNQGGSTRAPILSIPVVFHVMHIGEAVGTGSNITNAQILSCIDGMNRDFRRTAADGGIAQRYLSVDTEIEFCIAQKDPNGNPTSGITRHNCSSIPNYSTQGVYHSAPYTDDPIKQLVQWDPQRYLNVWIVREIRDEGDPLGSSYAGGVQGYATLPVANPTFEDGIIVLYSAVGNDPSNTMGFRLASFTNDARVMTHEVGHYLNLYHTFYGESCAAETNCNTQGDRVCDTPPTMTPTGISCNTSGGASASPNTGTTCAGAHLENYMDYFNNGCIGAFTQGQADRMRAALNTIRTNLANNGNCDNPIMYEAELVDFNGIPDTICSDSVSIAVEVRNNGSLDIDSLYFDYDNGSTSLTSKWTGRILPMSVAIINVGKLPVNAGINTINVRIDTLKINGNRLDQVTDNNFVTKNVFVMPKINLAITPSNTSVCLGDTATLKATGANSYTWDNNSTDDSLKIQVNTYYNIKVVGRLGACIDSAFAQVSPLPSPTATVTPSVQTICENQTASITASGGTAYLWNTGLSNATISETPTQDTTEYTVTVTNLDGCTNSTVAKVYISQFEAKVTASSMSVCLGEQVTLSADPASKYKWSTGDTTQLIQPFPPITTKYKLETIDIHGCKKEDSVIITVKTPVTASITPSLIEICRGTDANFAASNGATYSWSTGHTTQNIVLSNVSTDSIISVTVVGANGCRGSSNATIRVFDSLRYINLSGNTFICNGESTTLSATGGTQYNWSNGGNTSSITVSPTTTQEYYVIANTANCYSDTNKITVQVFDVPTVTAMANKTSAQINENINFFYTANNAQTYRWDFGDGDNSLSPVVSKSYAADGYYTATLKAYNFSCVDSSSIVVAIGTAAGFDEVYKEENILVYPNPTKDVVKIDFNQINNLNGEFSVSIFNALGQAITDIVIPSSSEVVTFDLSAQKPGIYFVQLVTPNGIKKVKVIKY